MRERQKLRHGVEKGMAAWRRGITVLSRKAHISLAFEKEKENENNDVASSIENSYDIGGEAAWKMKISYNKSEEKKTIVWKAINLERKTK